MSWKRRYKRGRINPLPLLVCAAVLLLVASPILSAAAAASRKLPVYSVKRDDKCVSLTFDAAWGDVILRTLGRKVLRAPGSAFVTV